MDTRFWGPSGWRFLHQITTAYEPRTQKTAVQALFTALPFVLPCKYCRAHLTQHMKKEPLAPALQSKDTLAKWIYTIHNHVNAKLRSQGIPVHDDPSYAAVKKYYEETLEYGCTKTYFPGWEFLFSIAETHPLAKDSANSSPIPNSPPRSPGMTLDELNEYNLLTPRERFEQYTIFWSALCKSLPFEEWRSLWSDLEHEVGLDRAVSQRQSLVRSLWKLRCRMESEFELQNTTKFADLCSTLSFYRSGCSTSTKGVTCRRKLRTKKRAKTLKA